MTLKTHKPEFTLQPETDSSKRAALENRLQQINADMAALTPDGFKMPETMAAKVSERLKNKELIIPDTEVLRQLLLEKARIAEQLDALPQNRPTAKIAKTSFSTPGPTMLR